MSRSIGARTEYRKSGPRLHHARVSSAWPSLPSGQTRARHEPTHTHVRRAASRRVDFVVHYFRREFATRTANRPEESPVIAGDSPKGISHARRRTVCTVQRENPRPPHGGGTLLQSVSLRRILGFATY